MLKLVVAWIVAVGTASVPPPFAWLLMTSYERARYWFVVASERARYETANLRRAYFKWREHDRLAVADHIICLQDVPQRWLTEQHIDAAWNVLARTRRRYPWTQSVFAQLFYPGPTDGRWRVGASTGVGTPSTPLTGSSLTLANALSYSGFSSVLPSGDTTGITDRVNLQAGLNLQGPIGGRVQLIQTGTPFYIDQPLTYKKKTATTPQLAPSLVGAPGGGGSSFDISLFGPSRIVASTIFPLGEFMVDYIGSTTTLGCPLVAYRLEGFTLSCQALGAGIRQANHESSTTRDIVVNAPLTPAPADTTGTPTGAFAFVNVGASFDSSYNNVVEHCYVFGGGKDGFQFEETASSSVVANKCCSINNARYNYVVGPNTTLNSCDAQTPSGVGGADYYVYGGILNNCTERFPPSAARNSVVLDNPFGVTSRRMEFNGCEFWGCNVLGTEAASSLVHVLFALVHAVFSGCSFQAGTGTSDWFFCDAGPALGAILVNGCDFHPWHAINTQNVNLNGAASNFITISDCTGLNPAVVQKPTEAVLVSGVNVGLGTYIQPVALTAARLAGAPLNPIIGTRIVFTIVQDGTGGRAVTWNAVFKQSWVDTGNTLNKRSSIAFVYDGTNWNQDGAQTPYV